MPRKKILILEDDEANAELISFYLEEEGFDTLISPTGNNFVDKVVTYQPDLITIDILLPDVDGFQVFKTLQQDERTRKIPVIFITVEESKHAQGLEMGASGFLAKPFTEKTFKEAIKTILAGERSDEKNSHS
ncbi:MAG: response regulator [Candidatus Adiutricales bacterium]|jgi:CheY-like chemotaxis protein